MNPLQKKCVIATAGLHVLLLVVLFVGPGFFRQEPQSVNLPVLKVIPLSAIEAAISSGTSKATPPVTPQPVVTPPPAPTPPQPVVTPPTPAPPPEPAVQPKPVEPEKVTEPEKPVVEEKPAEDPTPAPRPRPSTPQVSLVLVEHPKAHHHQTTQNDDTAAEARAEQRAERKAARERAKAFDEVATSLNHDLSSSTSVEMPGESSAAYANYGQIVKSIYENAWIPPDNASNDEASPKVHVVIDRDGNVIEAHIIEPSGDAAVDASVQRVLDRVVFIKAFGEGATEKKRSYNINFNLKAKRLLG